MADSKTTSQREELLSAINENYRNSELPVDLLSKINEELDIASSIAGIDGKGTALGALHSIWKNQKTWRRESTANRSNSWVAYAIGLTDVMPQGATLPERRAFARASYPDIDSDFDDERREDVISHIKRRYGDEFVSNVGTYGTMNMKSVTRNLVKTLDCAGAFLRGPEAWKTENKIKADEIIAALPAQKGAVIKWTDDHGKEHTVKTVSDAYEVVPQFREYMDEFPAIRVHAQTLEGLTSNFSTHASGILISNTPLRELAPCRPVSKKRWDGEEIDSVSTQFSYVDCETIGLIKFDILAIKMLSIIKKTVEMIKAKWEIDIDIENLPLDDRKTYSLFKTGNTIGCFQMEGWGMQKTCREIAPDKFEDIVATISLYRPGPMNSIPEYVARKNGLKPVDYFHPSIEPHVKDILAPTYGVLCYQEQVMYIVHRLAGFSMTDAYGVIKAVGKKIMDLMTSYGEQFVAGCMKKGVPEDIAREYWGGIDENGKTWGFIVPFADYGFNKAHSLCYGYNAYMTGFFKANYCEEFMASSLNVESARKKWKKVLILERDCAKNGISILRRDINKCGMKWSVEKWRDHKKGTRAEIRPSILCAGLKVEAAENIVKNAPYENMRDFSMRTAACVDKTCVEALDIAGFFPKGKGRDYIKDFESYRKDKKNCHRKGQPSADMFEDM